MVPLVHTTDKSNDFSALSYHQIKAMSKICLECFVLNTQLSPAGPHWGLETIHVVHTSHIFTPHQDGHKRQDKIEGV